MHVLKIPVTLEKLYEEKYKDIFAKNYLPEVYSTNPLVIDSWKTIRSTGQNEVNKYIISDKNGNIFECSKERYIEIPEEGCILAKLVIPMPFYHTSLMVAYIIDTNAIQVVPTFMTIQERDYKLSEPEKIYEVNNMLPPEGNMNIDLSFSDTELLLNTYIRPHLDQKKEINNDRW